MREGGEGNEQFLKITQRGATPPHYCFVLLYVSDVIIGINFFL